MEFQTKRHYKVKGFHQSCPHNYMQKLLSLGFIPESQFYIEKKSAFLATPIISPSKISQSLYVSQSYNTSRLSLYEICNYRQPKLRKTTILMRLQGSTKKLETGVVLPLIKNQVFSHIMAKRLN